MSHRFIKFSFLAGLLCVLACLSQACKPPLKTAWQHTRENYDKNRVAAVIAQEGRLLNVDSDLLSQHIVELANNYQIDPFLILALIRVESNFNTQAHSSAGALGLMQIMPCVVHFFGKEIQVTQVRELLDPLKNVHLGVHYLTFLWNRYHQDLPHTLAAYNVGPGRVDQLIARRTNALIAQGFCQKVLGYYHRYKADAELVAINQATQHTHF